MVQCHACLVVVSCPKVLMCLRIHQVLEWSTLEFCYPRGMFDLRGSDVFMTFSNTFAAGYRGIEAHHIISSECCGVWRIDAYTRARRLQRVLTCFISLFCLTRSVPLPQNGFGLHRLCYSSPSHYVPGWPGHGTANAERRQGRVGVQAQRKDDRVRGDQHQGQRRAPLPAVPPLVSLSWTTAGCSRNQLVSEVLPTVR